MVCEGRIHKKRNGSRKARSLSPSLPPSFSLAHTRTNSNISNSNSSRSNNSSNNNNSSGSNNNNNNNSSNITFSDIGPVVWAHALLTDAVRFLTFFVPLPKEPAEELLARRRCLGDDWPADTESPSAAQWPLTSWPLVMYVSLPSESDISPYVRGLMLWLFTLQTIY